MYHKIINIHYFSVFCSSDYCDGCSQRIVFIVVVVVILVVDVVVVVDRSWLSRLFLDLGNIFVLLFFPEFQSELHKLALDMWTRKNMPRSTRGEISSFFFHVNNQKSSRKVTSARLASSVNRVSACQSYQTATPTKANRLTPLSADSCTCALPLLPVTSVRATSITQKKTHSQLTRRTDVERCSFCWREVTKRAIAATKRRLPRVIACHT